MFFLRHWIRHLLGAFAAVGVVVAPVEASVHADAMAAHTMPMHGQRVAPGHASSSESPPHHGPMPCCDFCLGCCCCAAMPAELGEVAAVAVAAPSPRAVPVLFEQILPPRFVPYAFPFALPPPEPATA